jgi:hypothetical protein
MYSSILIKQRQATKEIAELLNRRYVLYYPKNYECPRLPVTKRDESILDLLVRIKQIL